MTMDASARKSKQGALLRLVLAAVLLLPVLHAGPVFAQSDDDDRRTISVNGEGIVRVAPDMAVVNFGVSTVADDPETARRENAEAARNAMNAVRELGIEERYIRLEMLRLQPNRDYDEETRRYVERGFEAVRQVVVEVHDLEMLPTLVAEIVQHGANRLNTVAYQLDDRDAARNEALGQAVANAQAKAQVIAAALGEGLGEIRQITEQMFDFPMPVFRMEAMQSAAKDAAAPEPEAYAPGELEVRVTVHAVYELQ